MKMIPANRWVGRLLSNAAKNSFAIFAFSTAVAAETEEHQGVPQLPGHDQPYPFMGRDIQLAEALRIYSKNLRIGLEIAEDVKGLITESSAQERTRQAYLEGLAFEYDFTWYFDGAVLRVSPVEDMVTKVIPLQKHTGLDVIRNLQDLEIYQPKFVHRVAKRSKTVRVTGPVGYVELIKQAIEAMDKNERTSIGLIRGSTASPLDTIEEE